VIRKTVLGGAHTLADGATDRLGDHAELADDVGDAPMRLAVFEDDRACEEVGPDALADVLRVAPPEHTRPRLVHGEDARAESRPELRRRGHHDRPNASRQ